MLAKTTSDSYRRIPPSRATVLVAFLSLVSCIAPQPKPPVISENLRDSVQNVGLVAIETSPDFIIEMPSAGSAEGASDGAKHGAAIGASPGLDIALHGGGYGPIIGLPLAAAGALLGAIVGSIHGASTAETEELIESAKALIEQRVEEYAAHKKFLDALFLQVQQDTEYNLYNANETELGDLGGAPGDVNWGEFDPDLVVETSVKSLGLREEHFGTNPKLAVFINTNVTLILVSDGSELYAKEHNYESEYFDYDHWSALEGHPIQDAMDYGFLVLAQEIAWELFSRK